MSPELTTVLALMGVFDEQPKVDTFDYAGEYELIKQKKSKLSRNNRDRVIRKMEKLKCRK